MNELQSIWKRKEQEGICRFCGNKVLPYKVLCKYHLQGYDFRVYGSKGSWPLESKLWSKYNKPIGL